jgi:hypothetical protein
MHYSFLLLYIINQEVLLNTVKSSRYIDGGVVQEFPLSRELWLQKSYFVCAIYLFSFLVSLLLSDLDGLFKINDFMILFILLLFYVRS